MRTVRVIRWLLLVVFVCALALYGSLFLYRWKSRAEADKFLGVVKTLKPDVTTTEQVYDALAPFERYCIERKSFAVIGPGGCDRYIVWNYPKWSGYIMRYLPFAPEKMYPAYTGFAFSPRFSEGRLASFNVGEGQSPIFGFTMHEFGAGTVVMGQHDPNAVNGYVENFSGYYVRAGINDLTVFVDARATATQRADALALDLEWMTAFRAATDPNQLLPRVIVPKD